jgi:ATP-binding cassette subfamily B protein
MMPIMQFIGNLGYVGVAIMGGWLAINGRISIGDIQAFIQYMNHFTQPITQVANIANVLQSTAAAAERVFDFLVQDEEDVEIQTVAVPLKIKGEVVLKNVSFGYNADQPIIKNFSIHIKPKQNVAIVGPTGAGKTTVVNLLMRFYDIDSGSISIDGIDTSTMKRNDVRQMFGMVLQDTWLFKGTIAENIAYGKRDATREQITLAAKAAHADHFICTLKDGYDTVVNENTDGISAGEKQLLTIARAILADAPMLILDEATSSVDTRTEALIQSAMDNLSNGRTSFVIAHRLSTIKSADVILVMRDGNIIEQGGHKELLSKNGYYTDLYNSQFAQV